MHFVSVVIPTYNRYHLLKRAIQSVLNQTFQDIEIIVVDDGSTDGTQDLFVYPVNENPKIRYLRQNVNCGAQATRNAGIRKAKGDWIAFLDSDDEWLPEKLEKQIALATHEQLPVVHCECYVQNGNIDDRRLFGVPPYAGEIYSLVLSHPGPMFQGLLVKKKCFEFIGLLDEDIQSYQEWDTAIRLAKNYRFGFIAEPLFVYHIDTEGSISKDMQKDADGWAAIVEKHEKEILKYAGQEALLDHYQVLIRKYYSLNNDSRAELFMKRASKLKL